MKIIFTFGPYATRNRKLEKNRKKIKKNTITASFQSKLRRGRVRKRENKNYCSDPFLPTRRIIENSKKTATKFVKVINTHMASFHAKISWKMLRKRENKNYRSASFLPNG